jgi:hypothetical protein
MSYGRQSSTACGSFSNRLSWPTWLGEEPATADDLKAMLVPYPASGMTSWPVNRG